MARKKPTNVERVTALLDDAGFVSAGVTQGAATRDGGVAAARTRYRLPDTDLRVTVGKLVTSIYEVDGPGRSRNFQNYKTRDIAEITRAVETAKAAAPSAAPTTAEIADVSDEMFA